MSEEDPLAEQPAPSGAVSPATRSRILVVEDNLALADNILELFEASGARVTLHADSERALAAAAHEPYDLAIVDVRLQHGVDGLALVPRLRAQVPHGEIIVVTGNATLGSAIEAVRHGVYAYLQKPFDPEDLLALGGRALAQVNLRKERAALAQELARSEALHRAVVESVESLIIGMDRQHRARMWNRSAAETLGWSMSDVEGNDVAELLLNPEHRDEMKRAADAAIRNALQSEVTLPVRTRGGALRTIRWRFAPMQLSGTQDPLVLATGIDQTERDRLAARAADAEALAAMGRLTAGLAHEIRNPLNAASLQLEILGRRAEQMSRNGEAENLRHRVTIVKAELNRLSVLLDEFLGLVRPAQVVHDSVDVGELITQVHVLHKDVAKQRALTMNADAPDAPVYVHGDASKLKQALVNLVLNALDAVTGRPTGTIWLRAQVQEGGRHVALSVEDNGGGLDPARAQEAFRPFVTTKEKGTGLGLPIVKRIAELHGGCVEVSARPGGGTIVTIALPQVLRGSPAT